MNPKRFFILIALSALAVAGYGANDEQAVNELIPKLANPKVEDRYDAQMQLQVLASTSSKPGHEAERSALGKVLAAKAADASVPQPARVWIVRQLEYMGGAEAVESLTKVMNGSDVELSECARRALEKNPAPAASDSLRAALEKAADARWKVGLVNSLGERGDAAAVSLIIKQLDDATVGGAAALALGKIANPAAVAALWSVFGKNATAGDALVLAANHLLAKGDSAGAKAIAEKLYAQAGYPSLKAAALSALAKADPSSLPLLVSEALTGDEVRVQQAALMVRASLLSVDLTPALMRILPKLNPSAKAQVLGVVDSSAEKQVIEAAGDSQETVRLAALEALGRMGGAASVPVLIKAALNNGDAGKPAAEAALVSITSAPAVAALEKAAADGEAPSRVAAINALASRQHLPALPALLKFTGDTDSSVRKAAFAALKTMAADAEIEPLGKLVLAGQTEAGSALEAAAQHAQNKPAAVKKLLALAGGDEQKLSSILDALCVLGGDEALAAVVKLAASSNSETQNNAVRALGNWSDFAASKPLLAIATNKDAALNQYVLAEQGIVRLVKSVETEPAAQRVELAQAAMNAARRDEEKKLALSAFASVPDRKAADALLTVLRGPALKKEACVAALSLAESLSKPDKKTAKELANAVKSATDSKDLLKRADKVLSK